MSLRLLLLFVLAGCTAEAQPSPAQPAATVTPAEEAPASLSAVHHVVFIGQAQACACTKDRVATSWAALQEVVASQPLPVERLDVRDDAKRVRELTAMHRFVAVPAVYFLADDGSLVEMLQGELSAEMIREITD